MAYSLSTQPEHGYFVAAEALDGDLEKVELVDASPDGGLNLHDHYRFTSGRAVKPEFMPKRMKWPDHHWIADFEGGYLLTISQRAKQRIEPFEPGTHQYLPVEFYDSAGIFLEMRCFLIGCNRLDGMDRSHAMMIFDRGLWRPARDLRDRPEAIPPGFDVTAPAKLVFNKAQIGRAHLWSEKHLVSGHGYWISDELGEALCASGYTGLRLSKVETV
jgi:Immunity protein family (Imm11)